MGSNAAYGSTYGYDVLDNLVDVWGPDANGDATVNTHMDYDALGRKAGMTDPDMGAWSYGYDAVGNLVRQTDAKNQRTCFYYDDLNRLKGKTYSTGTADCATDPGYTGYTIKYYYDKDENGAAVANGVGRRTVMVDASGDTKWLFDVRGRVTKETTTISGTSFITQWTYDAADRVKTMVYPSPGTETVTYGYNPQGLLENMTSSLAHIPNMWKARSMMLPAG